jgi:serine/threonine protein kinase
MNISYGLKNIHENGLIHHDFHCGNILLNNYDNNLYSQITDLGLCKPANVTHQSGDKKIYGVLPYVAPEVLRGKKYTQASDIYGFGIIAYEICTGLPPYHDIAHDKFLAIRICQGQRPQSNYTIPQLILDVIQQCWDADPSKRPEAEELSDLFSDLYIKNKKGSFRYEENSTINKQIKEADEINKKLPSLTATSGGILSYITHPQAVYTSKLLDFKELPEPKNADNDNQSSVTEYSGN